MGTLHSEEEEICQVQACTVTSSHLQLYLIDTSFGERSSVPTFSITETKRPAKVKPRR